MAGFELEVFISAKNKLSRTNLTYNKLSPLVKHLLKLQVMLKICQVRIIIDSILSVEKHIDTVCKSVFFDLHEFANVLI